MRFHEHSVDLVSSSARCSAVVVGFFTVVLVISICIRGGFIVVVQ